MISCFADETNFPDTVCVQARALEERDQLIASPQARLDQQMGDSSDSDCVIVESSLNNTVERVVMNQGSKEVRTFTTMLANTAQLRLA